MKRIIYISGRYRCYNIDGTPNRQAMAEQLADEQCWAATLATCDVGWIAPLSNSVPVEQRVHVADEHYIGADLAIIRRLRRGFDAILMRPGWDHEPISQGASLELAEAHECGLIVLHGMHGPDAVKAELRRLDNVEVEA